MELKFSREELTDFVRYLRENEKSDATQKKYLHDITCFFAFVGDCALDKHLILNYKKELERRYCVSSANSMLASLNTFLRFVGCEELCVRQFRVQKSVFWPEEKELTKTEYTCLVHTAMAMGNERLALLLQTICGTGIRVSELPFITVQAVERGEAVVSCKGKQRRVFIVKALRTKLLEYAKSRNIRKGSVFVTRSGKAMDRSNIWREMKMVCIKAGVDHRKVFPHNLRHLFARTFYDMEKDITKLADVLGHSNVNTTRIYTISSGREHRRQVENMRLVL